MQAAGGVLRLTSSMKTKVAQSSAGSRCENSRFRVPSAATLWGLNDFEAIQSMTLFLCRSRLEDLANISISHERSQSFRRSSISSFLLWQMHRVSHSFVGFLERTWPRSGPASVLMYITCGTGRYRVSLGNAASGVLLSVRCRVIDTVSLSDTEKGALVTTRVPRNDLAYEKNCRFRHVGSFLGACRSFRCLSQLSKLGIPGGSCE